MDLPALAKKCHLIARGAQRFQQTDRVIHEHAVRFLGEPQRKAGPCKCVEIE